MCEAGMCFIMTECAWIDRYQYMAAWHVEFMNEIIGAENVYQPR